MVANPLIEEFQSGQMTDLPTYPGGVDATALFEVVSPGNAQSGINYSISAADMAVLIGVAAYHNTIITAGASYNSVNTDTRILVNKTIGSATAIALLAASAYGQPVLVKDLKGDADANPITITFPGTYDGVSSPITINTPYGWVWFNPLSTGNFYAS